ncbi:potassium channel family protein [Halobacteriaceae archaeon GCM10025711]
MDHVGLFRRIGVNVIGNPQDLIAEYLLRAVERPSVKEVMHLGGGAEVFEVTVTEDARVAGKTLRTADHDGIIADDVLVVALQREDEVLTPQGDTEIKAGDLLPVFSKRGFASGVMSAFAPERTQSAMRATASISGRALSSDPGDGWLCDASYRSMAQMLING